jgi:outer membrane lipoprotein SlyB
MNKKDQIRENRTSETVKTTDANRDPLTGTPGAHPVGTGAGAAGGGAAGAAIGMAVGGPVGAAIGLAAGAVAGGLAGKGAAEAVNPTAEDAYWRDNYSSQPWVERNRTYSDYQPAFRTGYVGYARHGVTGKTYDEVESDLRRDYEKAKGKTELGWDKAKAASRAAWHRVEAGARRTSDNVTSAASRTEANRVNRTTSEVRTGTDANRDPISGAPGAHPVGTGVGAAGGGAAGAAIGAVGGPVGAAVGLVAGAVAGGLAGKGAAEAVNPTAEDTYWRTNYTTQSWVDRNRPYDDYRPAFRTGYEGYARYAGSGKTYDQVEADLQRDYERTRGNSALNWENAKMATRAAWRRVENPNSGI